MKKFALTTLLLGALTGGFASSAVADDCCFNPCAPPCCEWSFCDGKFRVGADYLYWKTEADNLQVGSRTTTGSVSLHVPTISTGTGSGSGSGSGSASSGSVAFSGSGSGTSSAATIPDALLTDHFHPNFKYDSGFRVWLGYELPCDLWEVSVAYTYLPSRASTGIESVTLPVATGNQINIDGIPLPVPLVVPGVGTFPGLESTAARWSTTFQYIDVDLARTVRFGECFRLRPHIGFRAAWGTQTLNQVYAFDTTVIGGPTTLFSHEKEKYQGYGLEGGLWADYHLGYGLSVVGHVGGSILYTKIKNHAQEFIFTAGATPPGIGFAEVHSGTQHTAIPSLDYFAGLQYADNFCDFDFNLHIGWEQHVWFDLSRLRGRNGNFSQQGLTAGLEVGF